MKLGEDRMRGLLFTLAALFWATMPVSMAYAEETDFHIDGLGQFRLNENIIARVLAVRADTEASDFDGPDEDTLKSPADMVAAMDSSPEFSAILSKHGLTSNDTLLFMVALWRAMGDAERQPAIDVSTSATPVDLTSAREANRIFYIQHKAELEVSFPPPGEDEDEVEDASNIAQ